MESCRDLYEYAFLIDEIRNGLRTGSALAAAVDHAVEECIKEGILKNFLLRHRAEVKNVILEEFDLKKQISLEKKERDKQKSPVGMNPEHLRFIPPGIL